MEFMHHRHSLNFLDINLHITNITTNKKYKFKGHQKDTITNIHINANACINPVITKNVFEDFLHHIKEEIQILRDMSVKKRL